MKGVIRESGHEYLLIPNLVSVWQDMKGREGIVPLGASHVAYRVIFVVEFSVLNCGGPTAASEYGQTIMTQPVFVHNGDSDTTKKGHQVSGP